MQGVSVSYDWGSCLRILSFLRSIGTHHVRLSRGEEYTDFNFKRMPLRSVLWIDSNKIRGRGE